MQSIFYTLKTGTGRERLSVIADIVSILGVSLATALGGAFALDVNFRVENLMIMLVFGLLFLAGASAVIALFLAASSWLSLRFSANVSIRRLLLTALWLIFGALFIYVTVLIYLFLGSVKL